MSPRDCEGPMLTLLDLLYFKMEKLTRLAAQVVLALMVLGTSETAFACVCRGVQQPPCVAFDDATAVFSGTVTGIVEAPFQEGDILHSLLISFSIEHFYKGSSTPQITVATVTGTDCDFGFEKGEKYFVYAYRDSKRNRLVTGVCTRTKKLSYADEDISHVRGLNASNPKTLLFGGDGWFSSRLSGAEIIVEGQGKRYKAVLDERGAFRIDLEQPGKYKVTVVGPSGYSFLNYLHSWESFP